MEMEFMAKISKGSSKQSRASTSILDLPVGILEPILQSACVDTQKGLVNGRIGGISGAEVKCMSSVCTRWRDVVRSSCQRACCDSLRDIDVALSQLHTLKNVTHVRVRKALTGKHARFLRALATEFPLLTSFHLSFGAYVEDLEMLSLLLSLKTDIRKLQVVMESDSFECTTWDCHRTLENMDYTRQVHLKKLTLDFIHLRKITFPDCIGGEYSIPVSTTLAQLAGLQELHFKVGDLAKVATLPPWLAELPAFVGLRVDFDENPCSSFLDSLGKMTSLKELVMTGHLVNAPEYEVVSQLRCLTSLELNEIETITAVGPIGLATTLQKLCCPGEVLPKVTTSLPLLEELALINVSSDASRLTFLQCTPNVRSLHLTLLTRKVAWPHLEHLAGLTSLSLGRCLWHFGRKVPVWHICEAQVPALQVLVLHSCRLLLLVDGLLTLERHVAISLCCTCTCVQKNQKKRPWFSSHSEYVAKETVCRRLPADAARQLFKDTRRPTPKSPGPCPTCPAFRALNPADDSEDDDWMDDDSFDDDSDADDLENDESADDDSGDNDSLDDYNDSEDDDAEEEDESEDDDAEEDGDAKEDDNLEDDESES